MELTKEHFDEVLKTLATKKDLEHLATGEELGSVKGGIEALQETLDSHTTMLDHLLTAKKNKAEEKTISAARFDRLEKWAEQVGQKLDIKLEL